MPKNKFQEFIFTLIMSGCMIYFMGVYNVALNTSGLTYDTFVEYATHSFLLEWLVGFLCVFFIASRTSKHFAFKIVKTSDRPMIIILGIQTFTVCTMVPLMSLFGTIESVGITINVVPQWLQTIFLNFIMAYPLQVFVIGPLVRWLFRCIFVEKENHEKLLQGGLTK